MALKFLERFISTLLGEPIQFFESEESKADSFGYHGVDIYKKWAKTNYPVKTEAEAKASISDHFPFSFGQPHKAEPKPTELKPDYSAVLADLYPIAAKTPTQLPEAETTEKAVPTVKGQTFAFGQPHKGEQPVELKPDYTSVLRSEEHTSELQSH